MASAIDPADTRFMGAALALARRGLGRVWPNPAVGCIILDSRGNVAGRGWTQPGGRPHAEAEALARAGTAARGGTAYVTLEPCSHHGHTPPCADALIRAGLTRVVVATEDPDPRVGGRGIAALSEAGIELRVGVCRADAERLNAGFLRRITAGRPLVTLKVATTLDGRIATRSGESQWITGEIARSFGHMLRASHDAVMTGTTTVGADDPLFTCRLPGMEDASPVRIIMDSRLVTPLTAKAVATATEVPTWIVTTDDADQARRDAFAECGVEVITVAADDGGRPEVAATLTELGERGLTRVLVEGGGVLAATMLRAGAVDRIAWFRSPDVIGGDGIPVSQGFGVESLDQMARFVRHRMIGAGRDTLELYDLDIGPGRE